MEDLDRPREVPGAADRILRTLESFGLEWDGGVLYQSRRTSVYEAAVAELSARRRVYACSCTRTELATLARTTDGEPVYPGTCRSAPQRPNRPMALRFRVPGDSARVGFDDLIQGHFDQDVSTSVGDFVIRRKDGLHAYQLAVVIDDAEQGITEVLRGADLLDNTPRQILLQETLGLPRPSYAHVPLVTEPDGSKLAKRRRSVALQPGGSPAVLHRVLQLLGQAPPGQLSGEDARTQLAWAVEHWRPAAVAGVARVSA